MPGLQMLPMTFGMAPSAASRIGNTLPNTKYQFTQPSLRQKHSGLILCQLLFIGRANVQGCLVVSAVLLRHLWHAWIKGSGCILSRSYSIHLHRNQQYWIRWWFHYPTDQCFPSPLPCRVLYFLAEDNGSIRASSEYHHPPLCSNDASIMDAVSV